MTHTKFTGSETHNQHLTKITGELAWLKQDYFRVVSPSIKLYIQHAITQKENQLRLVTQKHINRSSLEALVVEPSPKKETPRSPKKPLTR